VPAHCDLHNHLLPAVDDGCRSMEETLQHLRRFRSQGVDTLVFTPHLLAADLSSEGVEDVLALHRVRFRSVVERVKDDPTVPALHLGQEILARRPEHLEVVVGRSDVGLADGPALLVEFGFEPGFDGDGVVERGRAEGRPVVVAHPERYDFGDADPVATAARWRDRGALLQVNGGSLAGLYTRQARTLAHAFLDEGLVDVVASDHHGDHRPHDPEVIDWSMREVAGPEVVERLLDAGPRSLLGSPAGNGTAAARNGDGAGRNGTGGARG
jgi:protein-tyrosine phosphatase